MCGGARRFGRFGVTNTPRWKVEIRYATDETVASVLKAHGITRQEAEAVAEDTNRYLDHSVFYTELVQLLEVI